MAEKSIELMLFLGVIFAFTAFFNVLPGFPPSLQFMNTFDIAWFSGGIIAVGGLCAASGALVAVSFLTFGITIPIGVLLCGGALIVFSIGTIWQYIILNLSWIKLLIFTPLAFVLIYLIARLGRGGG